ncbi:MAG: hypothetical protein ACRDSL_23850 [Pseudonocardiaceae bacterium]
MSLNTQIAGDPQGCRSYGGWLRALGDGALDARDLLAQVSAHSDFCWGDHVGDLFRMQIDSGKRDAGALYDVISRVGDAVNGFADDLATAIASMKEARMVALQGGVPVTPTTIEPPPMPEHMTSIVVADRIQDIVDHSDAGAAYQTQLAAYQDADRIVRRAREQEREAHDTLVRRIGTQQRELEEIRRVSRFLPLVDVAISGPASTYAQASGWTRLAQRYQDHADEARRIWDDPFRTQAARTAALNEFLLNQGRAAQAGRAVDRISPHTVLGGLQRSALGRNLLEGMATNAERAAVNGGVPAPRAAGGVLRSLPAASVLGVGAGVAVDVAAGESPEQAIVSNGAAVGAGVATTTLLLGSAAAGPAGVGAVAAGIGMAWLANFTVDQIMSK